VVHHERAITDNAGLTDKLVRKLRHGAPGDVKPHIEVFDEVRWIHDRQRMERRAMYVDREDDYYQQEWFDLKTRDLTWSKEGRLSDPEMHGESARRPKPERRHQ
jgi:hypothetical protein